MDTAAGIRVSGGGSRLGPLPSEARATGVGAPQPRPRALRWQRARDVRLQGSAPVAMSRVPSLFRAPYLVQSIASRAILARNGPLRQG